MDFATINCVIAIVVNLAVGVFVLLRAPRETVNRMLALLTLALVLTAAGELVMRLADTGRVILLGARVGAIGWLFLGALGLHFMLAFTWHKALLRKWWIYPLMYAPSLAAVVIAWTTGLIYEGFRDAGQGFVEVEGALRYPAVIVVFVPFVLGLYFVWRFRRSAPTWDDRQDALVILIAGLAMLILSFITDALLIFVNKENPPVNILTFSTLMSLALAYAVTRHGFLGSSTSVMGRTLVRIMMDPLLVLDARGAIKRSNPAMKEMTGFSQKQLESMTAQDVLRPDGETVVDIAAGTPSRWSGVCLTSLEEEIPVIVNTGALKSGSGRRLGSVVVVHDIRATMERLLAEENARVALVRVDAERRHAETLQDMIDVACHELRTPAAVFKGYSALLSYGGLDEETRQAALESLDSAADRVTRLADSLLETSIISSGRLRLTLKEVVPSEVVGDSVRLIEKQFAGHRFAIEGGADRPLRADPDMLEWVLIVLLENAAKFSPEGSEVRTWWEGDGEQTFFHVCDRGEGIPEEHREAVFDRFYQVEDPLHHSHPGLGLGLFIAKRIVEAHGGEIAVRDCPGGGSDFYFSIPGGAGEDENADGGL
ncbi:MAG: PAS domain S-box protein [Actinobacteria bacterium]|nr:PAS domain S-box protein [Actinomycetota bacterium]MBU1943753.1 PAS domain S-box protein [Actinomycetota bacterium]MBU2688777.1 PAS domain S-box protein [Actinomycetota bacterium]